MFELRFDSLILAQDERPALPGEETGLTSEPGGQATTGGQQPAGRDPLSSMLPLFLVMIVLFLLFSIFGQRREKKKREELIGSIKKHDRVQTVGGVIGSIVEVKPDLVVLKVDESSNTRITFARSAIQQVITSSREPAALEEKS